jgi:undecaprenyl pyrophosphate synthase
MYKNFHYKTIYQKSRENSFKRRNCELSFLLERIQEKKLEETLQNVEMRKDFQEAITTSYEHLRVEHSEDMTFEALKSSTHAFS